MLVDSMVTADQWDYSNSQKSISVIHKHLHWPQDNLITPKRHIKHPKVFPLNLKDAVNKPKDTRMSPSTIPALSALI